jgi:type I restriction enzyme, S subunit
VSSVWRSKALAEICVIKPSKSEAKRKLKDADSVSFVPMEDLGIDQRFLEPKSERKLGLVAGSYTYFAEGDVLLAKITPCFENGKLGIARGLTNGIGFGSSEYIVFRPSAELSNEYLYYFLLQDSFRAGGIRTMSGAVGHKRVSKEFIECCKIPLPPLSEQQRIVAILDEAFAGLATATANTEKNLQNARELFDSHLASIFDAEDAQWEKFRLGDLSDNLDRRRKPITKRDRIAGPFPYYGATGILDHVEDYLFDEKLVLIGEDGAKWGSGERTAFIAEGQYWVNNHAHVIRPDRQRVLDEWIVYYLNWADLSSYITGLTVPKLNQEKLNEIPIPVPSPEQQQNILTAINEMRTQLDALIETYTKKLDHISDLEQAILQKAFSGELTSPPSSDIKEAAE